MPMVVITTSASRTYSLPGTGSGRRRPEASGSPSCILSNFSPLTAPVGVGDDLDRVDQQLEDGSLGLSVIGFP